MIHKCPSCGRAVRCHGEIDKLPLAERTGMDFLGRNVYVIEGVPGLFWLKNDRDSEAWKPIVAKRRASRGNGFVESDMYRLPQLEVRLQKAGIKDESREGNV